MEEDLFDLENDLEGAMRLLANVSESADITAEKLMKSGHVLSEVFLSLCCTAHTAWVLLNKEIQDGFEWGKEATADSEKQPPPWVDAILKDSES
ncbi:hypothetical protein LCGC14_0833420 [marine sediment metagenome]|uniref:Uncharacterized protein n=1 Tax=marine sediment metagenome TaxID=412755 RepID=A0A0F9Q0I6_9ZZZZ